MKRESKDMKRSDNHARAHSFDIFSCGAPRCGPHIVGLDEDDNVICEIVIARRLVPKLVAELQRAFPPVGGSGEVH